jgi:hypothetical protein
MKKSYIKFLSLLVLMTMVLSSCLNDLEDFTGQFSGSPTIAEFSEASNAATGTVGREIVDPSKPANFVLKVNIASPYPLDKDTKVTVALDNALIVAYNAEKGLTGSAAAVPVPMAALTISSYEVTIPAGKREADWAFTVDASKVPNPVTTFYLIPVKIVSAENNVVPSGNFGTKLVRILARNEFDGDYLMSGFVMRPGDTGGLEGYFEDEEYSLITVSGNAVKMNRVQVWANGSNVGGIDAGWTITINKATPGTSYPVTLVDVTQGAAFIMVPGYPSRYEIAAKTFFWSVQWGTATPKNRGCTDTLVYVGPR